MGHMEKTKRLRKSVDPSWSVWLDGDVSVEPSRIVINLSGSLSPSTFVPQNGFLLLKE